MVWGRQALQTGRPSRTVSADIRIPAGILWVSERHVRISDQYTYNWHSTHMAKYIHDLTFVAVAVGMINHLHFDDLSATWVFRNCSV